MKNKFSFETLNLDDKAYIVFEKLNKPEKAFMKDINDITWYRYLTPTRTYYIEEIIYCGKCVVNKIGILAEDFDNDSSFHYKSTEDSTLDYVNDYEDLSRFFYTREDAERFIKDIQG